MEHLLEQIKEVRAQLAVLEQMVIDADQVPVDAPVEEVDADPTPEPIVAYPSKQDVADFVINFMNAGGDRALVVEALEHYKAKRAGEVAEADRAGFMEYIEERCE